MNICFLVGIFSLEFTFMLPFMLLLLQYFFYRLTDDKMRRWLLTAVVAPQLLFFPCYFLLNKLVLGHFIGHYGAAVHLNFMASNIFFNTARYLLNYTLFLEYLPFGANSKVIPFLRFNQNHIWLYLIIAILPVLWFGRKRPVLLLSIYLFFMGLVPIINLYLWLYFQKESDRMGYLALVFFSMALSYAAFSLFKPVTASLVLTAYILVGCWFLEQNVSDWQKAGDISNKLTNDFVTGFNNDNIYILGEAENYNGAYLFTPNYISHRWRYDLDKRIQLQTGKPLANKIIHTIHFEMKDEEDRVMVQKLSPDSFVVVSGRPQIRLLRNEFPLISFEDSLFVVIAYEAGHKCRIIFKDQAAGRKIIYQAGNRWNTLN